MRRFALTSAVVAGLVGFALLHLHQRRFESRVAGGQPVAVLVAVRNLAPGEVVTPDSIAARRVPSSYVEARHIRASEADRIVGVPVRSGVKAGESVLWTDLASADADRRDLSGLIKSGMRAVSISTRHGASFGGLLRPGDRVDVLLTTERGHERITLPLLQSLLVLAVGDDTGVDRGDPALLSTRQSQVTLSATIAQAQALTHAASEGQLTVILRSPDDITVIDRLPETTSADLIVLERLAAIQRARSAGVSTGDEGDTAHAKEIEHVQ